MNNTVNNDESIETNYDTDDEIDSEPLPAHLAPVHGQSALHGQPQLFDVNMTEDVKSTPLPLCLVMNCRSACNKANNLRELLYRIGPSVTILSETWERERLRLDDILKSNHFKTISYYRKNRSPGGGAAIVYDKNRFKDIDTDIYVPEDIEAVWAVLSPEIESNQP